MNPTDDDRLFDTDPTSMARFHSIDLAVAARTSVPVLISGPAELALPTAIEIAAGGDKDAADSVMVVDAGDDRYLRTTLTRAMSHELGRTRAVVIQDVETLDASQQAAVMALVADLSDQLNDCRLITTTAVPLFDRVTEGRFNPELFYRLNEIHIKVGDSWAAGDRGHWPHMN
jgi:hypothetical protein